MSQAAQILSSFGVALALLILLALKWQIRIRISFPGALAIGLLTALMTTWANSQLRLSFAAMLSLEVFIVLLLTGLSVLFRFYRDPERIAEETQGVILSPADGEVLYVKEIGHGAGIAATKGGKTICLDEITKVPWPTERAYLVGIGMNLLNVHVNRAPLGGRIVTQKRTRGAFLSLGKAQAELLNERLTTVIKGDGLQVAIVQIASRLVRGIVSYVKEGDTVEIGQRVGMIRFGSQVDMVISHVEGSHISVSPGEKVTAGISVVLRYEPPKPQDPIAKHQRKEALV